MCFNSFHPFVEYHNTLVQNGVSDYDWARFASDFEKAIVERVLNNISICNMVKPKTFMKFCATISGDEEKADQWKKMFENTGGMTKPILLLTCLYVKDKENFLIPLECDRPKQCFTVLPKQNRTCQSKFCFLNQNRTEPNM